MHFRTWVASHYFFTNIISLMNSTGHFNILHLYFTTSNLNHTSIFDFARQLQFSSYIAQYWYSKYSTVHTYNRRRDSSLMISCFYWLSAVNRLRSVTFMQEKWTLRVFFLMILKKKINVCSYICDKVAPWFAMNIPLLCRRLWANWPRNILLCAVMRRNLFFTNVTFI